MLLAAALVVAPSWRAPASAAPPIAAPQPAPLIVGDGRTVHLVSLGGPATDGLLARIAADIGPGVEAVERFWGADWDREIVVVATGSDAQFATQARLDPRRQWTDIAAVSVADHVDVQRRQADGQRVVFAPGASSMGPEALRIVLTHELFHLAARPATAPDAPRWLAEGVADFVARPPAPLPPLEERTAAGGFALPDDTGLDVLGAQRSRAYDRAWWFARFVADGFGVDALRQLYVQACGPGHAGFDAAVEQALGVPVADLRARWAMWLTG